MNPPESLHQSLIVEEDRTPAVKSGADGDYDDTQKTYLEVLGICCPSEVPLIERILERIDGVVTVSVIVPSKTVIVVHRPLLVSQLEIGKHIIYINQIKGLNFFLFFFSVEINYNNLDRLINLQ